MEEIKKELENIKLEKEKVEEDLEKCKAEKEEILNSFKRERADFLNYKKEEDKRISNSISYFLEKIILEILSVVDSFEMAEREISKEKKEEDSIKGFLNIRNQLKDFLKSHNINEIDCIGKEFNPIFHEAVEMVELDGEKSNIIVEELKKGYFFESGKVIRASKVKVTK